MRDLNTLRLAGQNLARRSGRSLALGGTVGAVALALFAALMVSESIRSGAQRVADRLGADILVVPKGYEGEMQRSLLRGEPHTFVMSRALETGVASVSGVARTTSQVFVASLNAACCTVPMQLIGFDPATDFAISPWLGLRLDTPLEQNEVYIGELVTAEIGEELEFFGQTFRVAGRLERTGTGLDQTALMRLDAAHRMSWVSERTAMRPAGIQEAQVSSILVQVKPGFDVERVADAIRRRFEVVDVVVAGRIVRSISRSIRDLRWAAFAIAGTLWLLATGILYLAFSLIFRERKREFGILRALGTRRSLLLRLIVCEAALLSTAGAAGGVLLAGVVLALFRLAIANALDVPYLTPSPVHVLMAAVASLLATAAIGPLAAMRTAYRASRIDPHVAIREGER